MVRAMECLRKSAAADSWLCNLSPYLLALGAFRWVSTSRNKLQPRYVRQVITHRNSQTLPKASLSSSWARLPCATVCCGMSSKNMTKFFWRASEEMECFASHSQCLHFAIGEWNMEREPCPGSWRKCFGNDSILHILAVQLPAPVYLLHRAITGNVLATGDSNPKYSLPSFTECKLAQMNLFKLIRAD